MLRRGGEGSVDDEVQAILGRKCFERGGFSVGCLLQENRCGEDDVHVGISMEMRSEGDGDGEDIRSMGWGIPSADEYGKI